MVIGGGAAGFFAAIAAAEQGQQVGLLEAASAVLAKVRISGGGRCNVTHACFEPHRLAQHYPRGGKALLSPFSRFQPADTIRWFESRGVPLKTEADGRMFPVSDDSQSIVQCLVTSALKAGVDIHKNAKVDRIGTTAEGFRISTTSNDVFHCRAIVLATGGSRHGHRIAASLGHQIVAPVPSLFTMHVDDERIRGLSGVAIDTTCRLLLEDVPPKRHHCQTGPLLITHWGFSGPVVLKLSAWAARELHACDYRARIQIDWLREISLDEAHRTLEQERVRNAKKTIDATSPFALPRRLWKSLAVRATEGRSIRWSETPKAVVRALMRELKEGQFVIHGKSAFKEEFVTCGGVALSEVDLRTMSSRIVPGLYLAGEILDIDGVTGGFNFQNAWTTGWIAGTSSAGAT